MKFNSVFTFESPLDSTTNKAGCIWSIVFSATGDEFLVAAGERILICDSLTGKVKQSLKGHQSQVYCLSYSNVANKNETESEQVLFASGGQDHNVIIWNAAGQGLLKYKHSFPIQCLEFNPITHQLASATVEDYALWNKQNKRVNKYKLISRCLSLSWTQDGQFLALGLHNGMIIVCDNQGHNLHSFKRKSQMPIWCLKWSGHINTLQSRFPKYYKQTLNQAPAQQTQNQMKRKSSKTQNNGMRNKMIHEEYLVIGCWDQSLSSYDSKGTQLSSVFCFVTLFTFL
jgi:WD40 repeat protein